MKTHKFDGISLFSGLAITGIGLIFLIANDPSDIVSVISKLGTWFLELGNVRRVGRT